ncbi:conserved hypothetical protein [delta proteobacterium NaphS2]|nr:conserved hypothetical protein [delta proteobacterium NaphS2]
MRHGGDKLNNFEDMPLSYRGLSIRLWATVFGVRAFLI